MLLKYHSIKLLLSFLLLSVSATAQFSMEDLQKEIDAEIDSLKSLETPFEVTLKLTTDIESYSNSDGMDLILTFDVIKADPKSYSEKTMEVAMHEHRKQLLSNGFKNGGTYTFKVIRNIDLIEDKPGSNNFVVKHSGAYERAE